MASGVFLIQEDGSLIEMEEQQVPNENYLQELLAKYPNLLAGNQIDDADPRKWLLISREAGLPGEENGADRWSVDHLFLDQDAIPTLVEVKRSCDTRIRREVVGQMLDYAANAVVYWSIEEIRAKFEATCTAGNVDPAEKLREFLDASEGQEEFWQKAKTNLQAGKIRMLFIADEVPAELRRVVEFLNEQMDPAEVLAVEIKLYTGQNMKTLVPRVIGQTDPPTPEKIVWNEESFFNALKSRRGPEDLVIAREIYNWSKDKLPRFTWGRGKRDGSFSPGLDHKGITYYPIIIWTYGKIQISFEYLKSNPPFDAEDKRRDLLNMLNQVSGVNISDDAITKCPNIFLSVFKEKSSLSQLLEALDWVVDEIKAS